MFKKIIGFFLISAFLSSPAFAGPPPFCYQEEDGAPSGCFKKIKFANGTLTDNGDGTYSHSQAGAGGGDITDVGTCSSGGCFVDGTNQVLTFEGSTADTVESKLGATDPTVGDQTFNLPDMAAGGTYTIATTSSNVATATALAANGSNCAAGEYPLGVSASGAVESCTDATTEIAAYSQPLEATLTDIADGTILEDLVNTANPWADNEVADTITASNYLPLAGGTLTGELKTAAQGIEGTATDALTDCSTFSATGGGIFYDDSEGKWKKCQDNTLTDLDTTGGGGGDSVSVDGVGVVDPNFASTGDIDFVDTSNTVTANITNDKVTEAKLKAVDAASDEDVLTYESTTGDFEWHSRDEIVGGISAGALPNDSVLEADLKAVDAPSDEECLTYETTTGDFEWQSCGGGGSGSTALNLPIYSAKLTGAFTVFTPPTADACSQGAQIDAGDGNWRLLFDATTDECATWQFVVPDNYSSTPALNVYYTMSSATSLDVEFEASIMCVTSGDSADIGTASFSNVATATETVPGTAGYMKKLTITLTDDSCSAGDIAFVVLSTDANDATNDDATGDREVVGVEFDYA